MKLNKKLTDAQITEIEEWAEKKKKTNMNEVEKQLISRIESLKKSDWRGCRITNGPVIATKEDAQHELERLKKRQ